MSNKLEVLKNSLIKKEQKLRSKLDVHFADVKSANGQPLNDKRNGQSTQNRWERQNDAIRELKKSIEITKEAIVKEEWKIKGVEHANSFIPLEIQRLVESGELIQWRRHPNMFFVKGVDKARIVWMDDVKKVGHKYTSEITDKEQWKKFISVFNPLGAILNN